MKTARFAFGLFWLSVASVCSADVFEPYAYIINGNEAAIVGFSSGYSGDLVITNTLGGKPVTSIGFRGFYWHDGITSVTIPDCITTIEREAFYDCDALTNVVIGNGVTTIGKDAFYGCTRLTTIPHSVTGIGIQAFFGCTGLTSVTIPDGVTSIAFYAFAYCSGLTSVTLPGSVTNIEFGAFYNCYNLYSMYFRGTMPSLGLSPFGDCDNLTMYYLPTATNGWSSSFGGRPTKLWNPTFGNLSSVAGVVSGTVTGTPTIPVGLDVSTNLTTGPWVRLQTTNLVNGTYAFTDADASDDPARFYRIVGP